MAAQSGNRLPPSAQLALAIALVALAAYLWWHGREQTAPVPPANQAVQTDAEAAPDRHDQQRAEKRPPARQGAPSSALVKSVVIRDRDGDVVFRGQIDLSETVARIRSGRQLRQFPNDGMTFQNRERRLPRQAAGYYREWVHPTPRLSGPGPQRIVTGNSGEFYYTPDHYQTFQRLEVGEAKTP